MRDSALVLRARSLLPTLRWPTWPLAPSLESRSEVILRVQGTATVPLGVGYLGLGRLTARFL